MARDEHARNGERPDGVRRDIRVTEPDDKGAFVRFHGKLRADLAGKDAARAAEGVLLAPDERIKRDRDIAALWFT